MGDSDRIYTSTVSDVSGSPVSLQALRAADIRAADASELDRIRLAAEEAIEDGSHENADVRADAYRVLGLLGGHDDLLVRLSRTDPNSWARTAALRAVDAEAVLDKLSSVIASALDDASPYVVVAGLDLLTTALRDDWDRSEFLADVIEFASNENSWIRASAVRAAGELEQSHLISIGLEDRAPRVRRAAAAAVSALESPSDFEDGLVALLDESDFSTVKRAVMMLVSFDASDVARQRVAALLDRPGCRTVAARGLAGLPWEPARGQLERLVSDANAKLRAAAVDALAELESGPGLDIIRATLKDPEESVRRTAIRAAERHGAIEVVDDLADIARSGTTFERAPGLRAYTQLSGDHSLAHAMCDDSNTAVAEVADGLVIDYAPTDGAMHATYAIDAGGVANRGAARLADGQSATFADVDDAVVALAVDLSTRPVALGIEAPLWIPIGPTVADATRARPIDRARAWSAAAGAAVLASGLGILASALSIIAQRVPSTRVTVSPEAWRNGDAELLIYEAFISSDRQPLPPDAMSLIQTDDVDDPHQLDALYATAAFDWQITGAPEKQPDPVLGRVVNLATACVTAAGLRLVGPQHLPCVVVCARKRERRGAA